MAVWQTRLKIYIPEERNDATWLDWDKWGEFDEALSAILPRTVSWHQDLIRWGVSGGHEIDLWSAEEPESFLVRIDLRDDFYDLVCRLSLLFLGFSLRLERDGKLVDPTVEAMLSIIRQSNALRFVSDPRKYLYDLSQLQQNEKTS